MLMDFMDNVTWRKAIKDKGGKFLKEEKGLK